MKFTTKLTLFAATTALSAGMVFAAIDPKALADRYLAEGYSFVEIKQGPTQTKLEAIMDTTQVEVIYSNETGEIISQESQPADAEYLNRTGVEIKLTRNDFEEVGDGSEDDGHHKDNNAENDDHHNSGDSDDDDDQGDDHGGDGDRDSGGDNGGSGSSLDD
jgi:hypothetical protein